MSMAQVIDIQALDAGIIQSHLIAKVARYIDRLTVLAETESTSTWVKQQPEPGVVVCLAEAQTGGRGRRGRVWLSPPGSGVLLSIRIPVKQAVSELGMLSLQAGLAVSRAIQQVTGLEVQLKWPNDVMLDGNKLAGILVELQSINSAQTHAIIGVGINVCWPEDEPPPQPLADCSYALSCFSRNQLAATVLNELTEAVLQYDQVPACSVVAQWWQHDLLANQMVQVKQADKIYCGRAAGIAQDGGFVLDTDDGVKIFYSSEVSIRLLNPRR